MFKIHSARFFNYNDNKMAEQELCTHFFVLRILGLWTPHLNSILSYSLYYCWRTIAVLFMLIFFLSEFVDLCMQENVEGMTGNFLMSTVMFCTLLKVGIMLLKRKELIGMLDLLKLPFCLPNTEAEHKILHDYRRHARHVWTGFFLLGLFTLLMQIVTPSVSENGISGRNLPYSTWQPYSIEGMVPYAITYFGVVLHAFIGMPATITTDCLISGLMIVTASHLEILNSRLARLQTPTDVKICVQHHNTIVRFAERIGEMFGHVLFIQFLLSMINICSVIFVVFKSESRAKFVVSVFFLACMMVQLLLYCWYGNEVFLKSQRVAGGSMHNSNWISLPTQVKKALLLIMIRTHKPLQIKAGWLMTFSLDTFMMIVKTSYSAFNLLRKASKD